MWWKGKAAECAAEEEDVLEMREREAKISGAYTAAAGAVEVGVMFPSLLQHREINGQTFHLGFQLWKWGASVAFAVSPFTEILPGDNLR